MVSAEAFQKEEEERRSSDVGYLGDINESSTSQSAWSSSATVTPASSPPKYKPDSDFESDLEEAIRLSLLDGVDEGGRSPKASGAGEYDIPITYKPAGRKSKRSPSASPSTSRNRKGKGKGEGSRKTEVAADDLDYALQLSLAEERSRLDAIAASSGAEDGSVKDEFRFSRRRRCRGKERGEHCKKTWMRCCECGPLVRRLSWVIFEGEALG